MRAVSVLCGVALVLAAPAARAATFTGLGSLPGSFTSYASGVSADGSVVVGESSSVAFRWTASGGMLDLGDPPGGVSQSSANDVSADGTVIVGARIPDGTFEEAFRWTQDTGMVGLGDLPGDTESIASAISADGSTIVGSSWSSTRTEAFRWTASGGMVGLGGLPGEPVESFALGVSADGSVVIGSAFNTALGNDVAFLWTQSAGMLALGTLPGGIASEALAMTPDGSIVVGGSSTGIGAAEAFLWTQAGGMVGLGNLPGGLSSWAYAISADGSVIVGGSEVQVGGGYQFRAIIWSSGLGPRSLQDVLVADYGLDLTGWHLESAEAISADGRTIVGAGINPSGQPEAWIAVIPEPSTGLLVALGLAGLALRRRADV